MGFGKFCVHLEKSETKCSSFIPVKKVYENDKKLYLKCLKSPMGDHNPSSS